MKRAVVYARVSDRKQAERDLPVESQIEACRRKAAELGAEVLHVYRDDGITGRTDDRAGFQGALLHAITSQADYMVVWDSARFSRDQFDALLHKRRLDAAGVRLVYAATNIDRNTEEGWLADSFQQIIDEAKSRATSRDTRRSMMQAAREGFFMGGRVPYGYQAVLAPGGKRRRLQPDQDEAPVVASMFDLSARGVGGFAIAVMQNEAGITLRGRPWNKNTVLGILKSEVYVGNVIYNKFDRKHGREKPPEEWVRVQAHEPLVSQERFDAVQQGLARRKPADDVSPGNATHTFAGLLRCGQCGAGLKLASGTGRGGKVYYYYACNADVQGRLCTFKRLPADAFDAWMLDELLTHVLTEENVQAVIDQLDQAATKWVKERAGRRRSLVKELRGAEERRANLYQVLEVQGKQAPGIQELGPRLRELNEQIKRIELALVALEDEQEPAAPQLPATAAEAAALMRTLVVDCEDAKTLRSFVASIVKKIDVEPGQVRVDYHPECLVRCGGAVVRSTQTWLPVVGKLRTMVLPMPGREVLRAAA
jgi:DNA invertase Pin-like site-specific DNA recombinase